MHRRTLLTALGGGVCSVTGCLTSPASSGAGGATNEPTTEGEPESDRPADCPTSQGLDIEWPETLDADTVRSFVDAYEQAYYREVVVEYEPESQLDSYELGGRLVGPPSAVGNGWAVEYAGGGAIYRPTLALGARTAAPPDGADVVPLSEIDRQPVVNMLREALQTGEAEYHIGSPGAGIDRHLDLFTSLSRDFDGLSGPGDSETLYVAAGETDLELTVVAMNRHGDYEWRVWYYVDTLVVRRTTDEDTAPRYGTLLECRTLNS